MGHERRISSNTNHVRSTTDRVSFGASGESALWATSCREQAQQICLPIRLPRGRRQFRTHALADSGDG